MPSFSSKRSRALVFCRRSCDSSRCRRIGRAGSSLVWSAGQIYAASNPFKTGCVQVAHPESMNRRAFIRRAGSVGASVAFGGLHAAPSRVAWKDGRDLFPEGVASGDPDASSVLLWTRAPHAERLQVEVARDEQFERVVANASTPVAADADFTCRVLVGGLKPASVYWYRFS